MSGSITIKAATGGSTIITTDDTLSKDEAVKITKDGIIYSSPDGSSWKLTVADDGAITMVKV